MYVTFIIAVCIDTVRVSKGELFLIPVDLCIIVMILVYTPFLSKVLVDSRFGILHDFSKLKNSMFSPFKNNAISYQFLTGYEIIDSIIAFNLSKVEMIPSSYWKAIEKRSNLNYMRNSIYFGLIFGVVIFPAVMCWLFIYIPISTCEDSICDPLYYVIHSIVNLVHLMIYASSTVQVIVIALLTMCVHFFQIEVFKNRLEVDRMKKSGGQWKSQRHLVEEYLFHQELFSRSSSIWQFILSFSLVFSLIAFFAMCGATVLTVFSSDGHTFAGGVLKASI